MWKMMKADIAYDRALFVFLCAVVFIAAAINVVFGNLEAQLASLMFFSVVVIGITAGIEEIKTKRIRFLAGLPVPIGQQGIFRYSVFVPYWVSLMILLWLSTLISKHGHVSLDNLWWILTRSGTVFIWIVCMNLSQDLPFLFKTKGPGYILKWMILLFGVIGGPFVYFVTNFRYQSDPIFSFVSDILMTPTGALGLFFFSLSLISLSVYVFERRKSFTE